MRRREHGPQLSTRQVNESNGAILFEEEPRPMTEKRWIMPGLRDAAVGVVHKRPQDHPRGSPWTGCFDSASEGATVLGPGRRGEDVATFNRREHARLGLGGKKVQE